MEHPSVGNFVSFRLPASTGQQSFVLVVESKESCELSQAPVQQQHLTCPGVMFIIFCVAKGTDSHFMPWTVRVIQHIMYNTTAWAEAQSCRRVHHGDDSDNGDTA